MAEDFGLVSPKANQLTYIKRGVLWVEKKPYYIVELIKEEDLSYVMVYKVHPGTDKNPQPLADEVTDNKPRFSTTSRLGQIANSMFPKKATKKWVPKDPVYVAPVIPSMLSTFSGKYEEGFFDREEDKIIVIGGEKRLARGQNTGIFIGLSSIVWEDKVRIPTASLVKVLKNYQKQDLFFDLQGDNNSKNNPLSSYYKGV
jgi:hypothetical protein